MENFRKGPGSRTGQHSLYGTAIRNDPILKTTHASWDGMKQSLTVNKPASNNHSCILMHSQAGYTINTTIKGIYCISGVNDHDLIEEVPAPKEQVSDD